MLYQIFNTNADKTTDTPNFLEQPEDDQQRKLLTKKGTSRMSELIMDDVPL